MSTDENRRLIEAAVAQWKDGDGAAFFRLLADDVRWTLIGTTPLSKTYTSRRQFIEEAIKPLSKRLTGTLVPEIVNIIAEGENVVLQWDGTGTARSGAPYHNRYCWVMRMAQGQVVEGTAYLDTALVDQVLAD